MKPLRSIIKMLTWLGAYTPDENTSKSKKLMYIFIAVVIIAMLVCCDIGFAVFFFENIMSDLEKALMAVMTLCSGFISTYILIVSMFTRSQMRNIFDRLSEIYDMNTNEEFAQILMRANNQSQSIWRIYFMCLNISLAFGAIFIIGSSMIYCWKIEKFEADCFVHPMGILLPWNQHTITGYLADMSLEIWFTFTFAYINGAFLVLFISICLHHRAFYNIVAESVRNWNDNGNRERNDDEFHRYLISFHVSVKSWFLGTAQVLSTYILVHLIVNTIFMAKSVFQLDLTYKNGLSLNIYAPVMGIFLALSNLSVYCFLGKLAFESFDKMPDCLYDSNWQLLSNTYRKYLILIIGNMQKPLYYTGFGVATLNLETFTQLLKTVYSYYMIFKTLTH